MSRRDEVLDLFDKNREDIDARIERDIEKYRKGDMHLHIKDKDGNRIKGEITIEQKSHDFKYGANIFMLDELETEQKNEQYKKYFADAFNMATLPFYWSDLEPEKGKPRYDRDSAKIYRRPPTDLCMEFCRDHGIEPREHALCYEHFFPEWLRGKDTETVKSELERRMSEISARYAESIPCIEVTNEHWWGKGENVTDFYFDHDFAAWCYEMADKYFPGNKISINEWAEMWSEPNTYRSRYYELVENLILRGCRIDSVGMQYHMFQRRENEVANTRASYDPMKLFSVLDKFAELGRPIQITEVTIPAYSNDAQDEATQAEIIENLYRLWFSHPAIEQIIYWNLVDGYAAFAPQGDMTAGENYYYGGLLRFDLTPKPAYYTIRRLFEEEWHTSVGASIEDGEVSFSGFFGEYDVTIKTERTSVTRSIHLAKGGSADIDIVI